MIDPSIHVAIISYKRAGEITTHKVAPFAHIWVPESQGDDYRDHYGDKVITIPDHEDGNVSRKRNAVLNRSPCKYTVIVDDDITNIGYWECGGRTWLTPPALAEVIEHHYQLAQDLNVKLWGFNQNADPMVHYTYRPFSLLAPVLAPFSAHLDPVLRYSEDVPLKEDYDFWLQNILHYRKTLRANKYHYKHAHGDKPGGLMSARTRERERENADIMTQRWGSKIFQVGGSAGGKSATGRNILNSRIRIPIPGC